MSINWTKTFAVAGAALGTAFVALNVIAKKKKAGSTHCRLRTFVRLHYPMAN